jgi:alanine-synthesizing transaminase
MFSSRIPRDYSPNLLALLLEEKRRAGRPVLDLTGTNPTRAGLGDYAGGAVEALKRAESARYDPDPRGRVDAREAVAALYGSASPGAPRVSPDRIVLTASTSEAYAHLFRLLCDPGDEAATPRPSYPLFEPLARLEDVALRQYRLAYDGRWSLDQDSLEGAIDLRTRAVIAVQPNNPTGSCLSTSDVEAVERICVDRHLAFVSDEVFAEFPWAPGAMPLRSLLGGRTALTFALGGISKLCGLPHLKLGWIAVDGPEREVKEALHGLEWVADLFLSVGSPIQAALPEILASRGAFLAAARARIAANLNLLRGLRSRGATLYEADGGWSAVLRLEAAGERGSNPRDTAEWALERHAVHVHPGHFYDLHGDEIVVSLLTDPESMSEGMGRLCGG